MSPAQEVPGHIPRPPYADTGMMPPWDTRPQIHSPENLKKMRAACKLAANVLDHAGSLVKPGVTTEEIDRAVHKMTIEAGAYPSPLNYGKFPKSVCTSVNECICHGIPDSRPLREGDIVNIDVTVYLDVCFCHWYCYFIRDIGCKSAIYDNRKYTSKYFISNDCAGVSWGHVTHVQSRKRV